MIFNSFYHIFVVYLVICITPDNMYSLTSIKVINYNSKQKLHDVQYLIASNSNTQIGAMINGSLVNTTSFEEYFPDLTWWERGVVFVWLLVMFLVSTIGNAFVLILSKDLKVGDY